MKKYLLRLTRVVNGLSVDEWISIVCVMLSVIGATLGVFGANEVLCGMMVGGALLLALATIVFYEGEGDYFTEKESGEGVL